MIKLQDFARECSVTDRQVQRLLKKYEDELTGLFERKGPNGTWFSDEACEILRSKMRQQPITIIESDKRIDELQERIRELEHLLSEKDKMLTFSQQATQEAQNKVNLMLDEVNKVKALEEGKEALEGRVEALENENERMKKASLWERIRGWK